MKVVITVLGADGPGIVAGVSAKIAAAKGNILDISQTILQNIFTMTMLVELSKTDDFEPLRSDLDSLSQDLGVQIQMQREDVFRYMYRI